MNYPITNINSVTPTMSSREIAQLTGKRHGDVLRDIRTMLDALRDDADLRHVREERDSRGYTACIHLDKELTETLVTGYSIPLRHRVIKRLSELEQQQHTNQVPKTLPEALRLAADLAEKNDQLMVVARQQGQRIKALHNLFDGGVTPFEFAKRLNGVNCQLINATLSGRGWLYKDGFGHWRASSKARDLYLTERSGRVERSDGRVMVTATPVLLQRGAALLHKLYLHEQLPMKQTWNGQFTHEKDLGVDQ